jgi:hypothetical protein
MRTIIGGPLTPLTGGAPLQAGSNPDRPIAAVGSEPMSKE